MGASAWHFPSLLLGTKTTLMSPTGRLLSGSGCGQFVTCFQLSSNYLCTH